MTIAIQRTTEDLSWEFYDYILNLEKEWRKSMPRFTDKELLEIFPEVKEIIPKKIAELEEKREEFLDTLKKKLTLIKHRVSDEFSQWFWREWVKITDGVELIKVEEHIGRLRRLLMVASGKKPKGRLTEEQIQQALTVPIENLISQPLRRSGKALVGLCPFHNERHPSFFIYPETNSCWCYGCNQGGNIINFLEILHGYSFKEAVWYLIGK